MLIEPIEAFIVSFQQKGIKLWSDAEGQLRFSAPRGALTPSLQTALKARKAEVIAFLQQVQTTTALPQVIVQAENRYDPFPLNDIQHAYWLGRRESFSLHAPTHLYDEYANSNLDAARLAEAWQQLIDRHDMLRAIVLPSGKQQVLPTPMLYTIKRYDVTHVDDAEIEKHLETVRHEMTCEPLACEQWPLFEIRFSHLPDKELRIHFSLDMLIADWGSYDILLHEWLQLYHHPEQKLPSLAISYRDYTLAERKIKETDLYQRAKTYWHQRLPSFPPAPELPLAIDPSTIKASKFVNRQTTLDADSWSQLKNIATTSGLTPTALMLTVFSAILARWCKQPKFTLNLTLFNRLPVGDVAAIEKIVGDFTSLTMLTVDFSDKDATLAARGKALQQQLWQDLDQRYYSGVEVLQTLATQQQGIGSTLMPIVFTSGLGLSDQTEHTLGNIVYNLSQTPQVWLDNQINEVDGCLHITWEVVESLFPSGVIDSMFAAYHTLLQQLSKDASLWQTTCVDIVPLSQQFQPPTALQSPASQSLLQTLFIQQVIKTPHNQAVIASDCTLSYTQLYQASAYVATYLRENGAQSNQLVAIVMHKGWEQVVAAMGIVMSGAAYLPIDPDLPLERQHYLLEQAEVRLLLTQPSIDAHHIWPDAIHALCIDEQTLISNQQQTEIMWESTQKPSDLAYVIYTSGSTGQPKGVMIDHQGVVNTIIDINERFHITSHDRVLALSALNFDLSVYDIFGLLAVGGTIVMPAPEDRRDPAHWVTMMNQHQVSVWNTVPALMQMLIESHAVHKLQSPLNVVMMSGDWIPLDLPCKIQKLMPKASMMSLGGATEASIWSIYYPIQHIDPTWKSIPYGKPLGNQTFHVFNEHLEECPVWVVGHLYIGGMGLALGYWHDAEKTDASFFIHPRTHTRLYKTGDLGRYLPDGNIEFMGRDDFQVKIRGYRIELGEIEANLLQDKRVKEVVVTAVGENKQHQQLLAYVVLNEDQTEAIESPSSSDQAAYGFESMQGTITDAVERLQFKLQQSAVRNDIAANDADVSLPATEVGDNAYLIRQSYRHFVQEPIDIKQLSALLATLRSRAFAGGVLPKYQFASAGSLYPIQSYVYIKPNHVRGIAGGLYYYHPAKHYLAWIASNTCMNRHLHGGTNKNIFDQSAFCIFLVAEYKAIEPMYGDSARDFCLLEAGYMSQLLMMKAAHVDLGLCPIGGMNFKPLRADFALSDSQEMIHSFMGGGITAEQQLQLNIDAPRDEAVDQQLLTALRKKLPDYMVPDRMIILSSLPLTNNGKVDRKALPMPDVKLSGTKIIHASNDLEHRLLALVEKSLDLHGISMVDDFIALGANSLDMVLLHDDLEAAFDCHLEMVNLFQHTTVQDLAKYLGNAMQNNKVNTAPPSSTDFVDDGALTAEQIDLLAANIDNLTESEAALLLAKLQQEPFEVS